MRWMWRVDLKKRCVPARGWCECGSQRMGETMNRVSLAGWGVCGTRYDDEKKSYTPERGLNQSGPPQIGEKRDCVLLEG